MTSKLDGDGGIFSAEQVEAGLREPGDRYLPRSRLVSVEQTTNMGGGRVWPLERSRPCSAWRGATACAPTMDGARLMNAVVASGVPAADFAVRLRHRLAGLQQGAGRAGGRRAWPARAS